MLAIMLIAQITVISARPLLSPEEAVRVLRASRSPADMTDVHVGAAPEVLAQAVRSSWRPGDGPFGPFDDRLSQGGYVRRGSARSIHVGYTARGRLFAPGVPVIGSRGSHALTSRLTLHPGGWRSPLEPPTVIPSPRGPLQREPLNFKTRFQFNHAFPVRLPTKQFVGPAAFWQYR
jgi:hypothetical protein